MLNRQWFYLTVCGNNSFTYVFHKCDPIRSQGRYKPTLSIEYNLQRFSHTKRVDELSYKRHPVLGTNNSSHSFLKNDYYHRTLATWMMSSVGVNTNRKSFHSILQVTLNIMGSEKGSDMCSTFSLARFF